MVSCAQGFMWKLRYLDDYLNEHHPPSPPQNNIHCNWMDELKGQYPVT